MGAVLGTTVRVAVARGTSLAALAFAFYGCTGDQATTSVDGGAPVADGGAPTPPPVELGRHAVAILETRMVVPSAGLPPEAHPLSSNNNLDVVRHVDGRVYLAFRTAPDHFASDKTVIYVVSSADEIQWTYEAQFTAATDLREPRLLSWNGNLFLYLAQLGTNALAFEPKVMSYAERRADGTWSPLTDFYRPGFIPWRARVEREKAYLMAYEGGAHIYAFDGQPLFVHMLTSGDGRSWGGVNPADPVVSSGGGSEADFTLGEDGTLFAVIRNEAGDETGWGSKVCRATANDISRWTCKTDRKKYDSPLMFFHDGEAYLLARRNVTATGEYDLREENLERGPRSLRNQTRYSGAPKRCSLWRYVQAEDRIAFILDLPSRGDTCFPAMVRGDRDGRFVVYNYSSDVTGPDLTWSEGQAGPTYVYRHVLDFLRR